MDDLRLDSVERKQKVSLTANGQKIQAYKGETVLAALIAAGYKSLKKNPVNKKPRGALCGMGVCFECTMTIDGTPNVRACMTEVRDGMNIQFDE